MILQTRHSKASEAADAWEYQYDGDRNGVAAKIRALGKNPAPDAVDAIIGNSSWTRCTCDECDRDVEAVVQFGDEEPYYDSDTVWVCRECLELALKMFETQESGG